MRWSLIALPLLVLSLSACAEEDARLEKPLTLAVKGEALSDIMPMLEEQTGVRLKVAHDIADQKATIFVDKKPLKEVMAGLQTLFRYTWSYKDFKGRRSYELSMPAKLRREREEWRKKAIDKAWPDFEAEMKRMADMPVKTREELDRMFDQTEWQDGIPPVYQVDHFDSERRKKAVARLYRTLSPDLRKALRDGMTICWDLNSPEPEWKIPAALEEEFREGAIFYDVEMNFPETRKKKDLGTLTVELSASSTPEKFRVEAYERLGKAPDTMGYVFRAYEKLLSQVVPPTENSLPRTGRDSALDGKVSYTSEELAKEAALPELPHSWDTRTHINRSDLLAILHKKLGLQIISDHYSHWYRWSPAESRLVRSILESFGRLPGASAKELERSAKLTGSDPYAMHLAEEYPEADWGWDGKILYMRARDVARMDSREIPNRFLRRWQAVSADSGYLGLDELAEIQMLTDEQLKALGETYPYLGIARAYSGFERNQALLLYGLLNPSQRQQAFSGGSSTHGFSPQQRAVLTKLTSKTFGGSTIARRGERVGIYDELGHRIDKPDAGEIGYPVSVEMVVGRQRECILKSGEIIEWKSLEEALKLSPSEKDRALIRKGILTDHHLVLRKADGTESKVLIQVLTLAPNGEPARQ